MCVRTSVRPCMCAVVQNCRALNSSHGILHDLSNPPINLFCILRLPKRERAKNEHLSGAKILCTNYWVLKRANSNVPAKICLAFQCTSKERPRQKFNYEWSVARRHFYVCEMQLNCDS